ncbi:MAG: 4Fe-4S dicluster domain-containing protein [Desulfarculaceae bacterium]|nr:4Fe-4S dicluster domain-containing protein [Desulfarculaceae bacterium]MCF8072842.1 4Fe-4S dicluster domain-containing protein [Desulfarculaceae bacterium]MCF8101010.1 4Fe-4S dicluster domain-containing protein [Desulfarculaceae bacterium]MCF8115603.1 4Fe-4S dicluster domain-containing protein [Desulfarculaceae bacterium]
MQINRRNFFKIAGATAALPLASATAAEAKKKAPSPNAVGCLVDTTLCVGCRKCEQACNQRNHLPQPKQSFEEMAVLENLRRMDDTSFTVVNKYYPHNIGTLAWRQRPTYVKFQCMHCADPSCVSACIVGALSKAPNGAVVYDANKCIGCRYCMIACPFQVPAYEYHDALTPQVRKCTFCFAQIKDGGLPACAQVCPREVITFGPRDQLLKLARWKMKNNPGKYHERIYGEREVGGTSWLYLASEPFENIGFPDLSPTPPPRLTESIQHAITSYLAVPLGLYGVLGGIMWLSGYLKKSQEAEMGGREQKEDKEAGNE